MNSLVPALGQLSEERKASLAAFGVILAACRNLSRERLEAVKSAFAQEVPDVVAHFVCDEAKSMLGVLLEQQKLSDTHFHALRIKARLLETQTLSGGLLIAGFSEDSRTTSQRLIALLQEVKLPEKLGELRLADPQAGVADDQASILIVGPDPTVNEFLTIYLQRKGYQVLTASDGLEGMQKFQEATPDLVITDLYLPVLSGYQLMERIRQSELERASKIVVLTDKRLEEDVQKSLALGASDYITKPFSPVELEARVKRLIS